ncbi:MAG: NADH-quinone oxidoreductase subunit NuoG [Acidimicrobiales bacterium]
MADVAGAPAGVSITVDGRVVETYQGELIIAAAERAGVFIPRFCYHPRMKSVGMCRMCLVEVSGPRGPSLQPACFVEVTDGQEVFTGSPAARKAQEGVIEYLLLNHPLDCPVCDKGGECPLQDQSVSYGPGESRFDEEKRHWAKPVEIGPLVLLDRERCIQCARCTRFAEEVAGEPFIDFAERGDRLEVAIFPGDPFTSYFAGNTIQICPVGALTSVPYRFKSRPWDLEQVETTCTSCAVGCRVAAQSSAGALVRYLGVDSDPVNQSWLCDRGRFGYEAVEAHERLGQPLVRRDTELVPATWNEALGDVADALARALEGPGAGSVGVIGGARLANEDAYAWVRFAKGVIGTDNFDAQLGDGLPAELVASLPRATIEETVAASTVIILAGDLREELPVLHLRLRQAAANEGLRIIDCSPVASGLSKVATWRPYRPGGAVELARSLVATETGDGVVVVLGRPSLAEPGDHIAAAAGVLAAAWPQARFLPALRRGNVHGAIDLGCAPGLLPGRVPLEEGRAWFAEQWGSVPSARGLDTAGMLEAAASGALSTLVLLGADPLSDFPDRELATRALERVEFLVAVDTVLNASSMLADVVLPAAGYAERGGTTTNLEGRVSRLAAKVVPPGVARADWVIATELADRLGTGLDFKSLDGIWAEIERVAPAYSGCTAEALGAPGAADGIVVPLKGAPVGLTRRPRRLDPIATPGIESVEEQGAPLAAGASLPPGGEPEASEQGVDDEEGTGEAAQDLGGAATPGPAEAPSDAQGAPEQVASPAPGTTAVPAGARPPGLLRFDPGAWTAPATVPPAEQGSWRLVVRRGLYDHGTLVQSARSLAPLARPQQLWLGAEELERLGVVPGDRVRVRSPRGELVLPVTADAGVPSGVALVQFNAAPIYEASASALIDCSSPVVEVRLETVS